MNKILVMDVPAEKGGALTILNQYYQRALNDTNNEWIFVTSLPKLSEVSNVKTLRYPWIKKSWIHRLYFDHFVAPRLIKKYAIDEVLSLQNIIITRCKVPQTVYVHQPLPFIDQKFSFKENNKFWIYQNLISKKILKSITHSKKVIVQTKWMKEAIMKQCNINEVKIKIDPPNLDFTIKKQFNNTDKNKSTFFYPASAISYKNHEIIIEASKLLKKRNIHKFDIIFTLDGNENVYAKRLIKERNINNLPIKFVGQIDSNEVMDYYTKSVLIFSSFIETFGLPMLEAKMHNTPILASNALFSKEILGEYDKVKFFDYNDSKSLADFMEISILGV